MAEHIHIDNAESSRLGVEELPASSPDTSMKRRSASLARRLALGAGLWSLVFLLLTGIGLSQIYRTSVVSRLDSDLDNVIKTLVAATESNAQGEIEISEDIIPNDPRYLNAYTGYYWSIWLIDENDAYDISVRSNSLWDSDLTLSAARISRVLSGIGDTSYSDAIGPLSQPIRQAAQAILLPDRDLPVILIAAMDKRPILTSARRFEILLGVALTLLGVSLVGGLLYIVRVGLSPLRKIGGDIADVRDGEKSRLDTNYPREVAPLGDEVNKLLEHNEKVVSRARTHVGNLAHALKTPIAVLLNEATHDDAFSDLVRRQAETMSRNVSHYLKRAQAAARAEALGVSCSVAEVAGSLSRMLMRLYDQRGVKIHTDCQDTHFRGEREDFEELLGNLTENACKWCHQHIWISAERRGERLYVDIEDDGPGLSEEECEEALKRGMRLDEQAPGTGLGLSIVKEIAEAYNGTLALGRSEKGGLKASLDLPAAHKRSQND